ncbi:hypothetical protein [Tengunoibacter tsumagoiensis]|uniref:hypothetical protein n=1 Tax=Tengunoibacter tsumagoiensis TaxID=2014871 RepID=UPI000F83414E|nr:hypothetical protein [Tengunoibacter tsumagoiensis]
MIRSEIDDQSGHVWQCRDNTYDENQPASRPTPAKLMPTDRRLSTTIAMIAMAIEQSRTSYLEKREAVPLNRLLLRNAATVVRLLVQKSMPTHRSIAEP